MDKPTTMKKFIIARSHVALAIEGAMSTNKRFTYKSKNVIYWAKPFHNGVQVTWAPRYRKP